MKTTIQEYKDKRRQNRMRVIASENGKIIDASTQGYSDKKVMINSAIRKSVAILARYAPDKLSKEVRLS